VKRVPSASAPFRSARARSPIDVRIGARGASVRRVQRSPVIAVDTVGVDASGPRCAAPGCGERIRLLGPRDRMKRITRADGTVECWHDFCWREPEHDLEAEWAAARATLDDQERARHDSNVRPADSKSDALSS
jgi:hypothetical protein